MRLLDLFCGRFGWSRAFAERGWECVGVDLVEPPEIPNGCTFIKADILRMSIGPTCKQVYYADGSGVVHCLGQFDFICASSVCDGFASFGMKHWQPNPRFPQTEITLFNHTRSICEASGVPYVMENVRTAQQFVGKSSQHCGPFYLWGNGVPPLMPQGISKAKWKSNEKHGRHGKPGNFAPELLMPKAQRKAKLATIPMELSRCVCDYAERILSPEPSV